MGKRKENGPPSEIKTRDEIEQEQEIEAAHTPDSLVKVKFVNTYVGKLGVFYRNNVYDLTPGQYETLKGDCEQC
jgi:hypothetical protein